MKQKNLGMLWAAVLVLGLTAALVGGVAGYRADEASMLPGSEIGPALQAWSTTAWALAVLTFVAFCIATIVTIRSVRRRPQPRSRMPIVFIGVGLVGAVFVLPAFLIAVVGLILLIAQDRQQVAAP